MGLDYRTEQAIRDLLGALTHLAEVATKLITTATEVLELELNDAEEEADEGR